MCQYHIDRIAAATLTEPLAVRDAVLALLMLTRNTDEAGRANRADIDRELARIREDPAALPQCGAVSADYGGRCSLPLGHSPGHVATNAAGAPCVVWG